MKTAALSSVRRFALAAIAAGLLAAHAPRARAAIAVVDQQNTIGSLTTGYPLHGNYSNVLGQSFTPGLASMNAATFVMLPENFTVTLQLSVYAGSGFGGALLGTSAAVTLTNTSYQPVEFDLATPLALTPGSIYTLAVSQTAGDGFLFRYSDSNPYAGGLAYYGASQSAVPAFDAVFAEGVTSASLLVPEPGTWVLCAAGMAGMGLRSLRRRAA